MLKIGPSIYMEVIVLYGYNIIDLIREFKIKAEKEIERLTAMNVENMDVVVKGIQMPEKKKNNKYI